MSSLFFDNHWCHSPQSGVIVIVLPLPLPTSDSGSGSSSSCLFFQVSVTCPQYTSGKRGLVLKKPKLLWVSLETPKTSKTKRHPGKPWRKVPNVQIAQSTPKALSKHPRVFLEHLQGWPWRNVPWVQFAQSTPKALSKHPSIFSENLQGWSWRNVSWVQFSQSTPKALSKHPRVFPEHLQNISRPLSEHSQITSRALWAA